MSRGKWVGIFILLYLSLFFTTGLAATGQETPNKSQEPSPAGGDSKFYHLVYSFGEKGTSDGQFTYPVGIALDNEGNIHVTDWRNNNIQKYTTAGRWIMSYGKTQKSDFIEAPVGIAIDRSNNVYVTSFKNHTVCVYNTEGKFIRSFGGIGRGLGQLLYPRGLDVDEAGNIYVADYKNLRVEKFSPEGKYLARLDYQDPQSGKKFQPRGLTLDSEGNLYVAYSNFHLVGKFDRDLKPVLFFGKQGNGPGEFNEPRYTALDSDGNIFVSDYKNNRIQVFNPEGKFLFSIGENILNRPEGLTLDQLDNLYVVDAENCLIRKFKPPDTRIHRNQARIYLEEGKSEEALKEYLKLLELDPENKEARRFVIDTYRRKAQAAFDRKDWPEALRYYNLLLELVPEEKDRITEQINKIKFFQNKPIYVGITCGIVLFVIIVLVISRAGRKSKRKPRNIS